MSGVSARPRDVDAPAREPSQARERATATREREPKKTDEASSADPVENTDYDAIDQRVEGDATRSVQDLLAAAMKMFAKSEETIAPVAHAQITAPALQMPSIEAAVQQVLDQITAKTETKSETKPESGAESQGDMQLPEGMIVVESELPPDAPMTSKGPVATTAVREPAPLPENPNPSHVNLVLEDGAERVVVTVAVRGTEVHAMLRGGDEQTAASLARNAASLDHALRAGGLDLASFTSERDLDHHAPHEREQPETQQDAKFDEDLT
ncbi:MAG: hypothetical protein ACKV2T_31360 [Kofleriaceae bacterium]